MDKLVSMSAAVKQVIDDYPIDHHFYGNELKEDVVKIYPEAQHCYVDTVLRMARRHRRFSFCVVDQNNSLYKKCASVSAFARPMRNVRPQRMPVKQIERVKQIEHKPVEKTVQGLLFCQVL